MKTIQKVLALAVLAGGSMFAQTRVSIGIGIGTPAPRYYAPRVAPVYNRYYVPPSPGPGYIWTAGYFGPRRVWVPGYWRTPVRRMYVAPAPFRAGVRIYRRR